MKKPTPLAIAAFWAVSSMLIGGFATAAESPKKAKSSSESQPAPAPSPAAPDSEKVNIEGIKERYWARGDESEVGVVQNRLYSKARKFDLNLFGGTTTTDPFLTVRTLGGSIGFHFNEYLGASIIGFKSYVSPSGAYTEFQNAIKENAAGVPAVPSTNEPSSYLGAEAVGSIIYGKLSLLGKSIIYYDLHLLGGVGVTSTETGNYVTPSLGIGQQIFLSKATALRVDYRILAYRETLVKKSSAADQAAPPTLGQPIGQRNNFSHSVVVGIDFLVEVFK